MGFLDHSTNNIIVDAVLTDIGRQALSRNDGSFSIYQFALADDEIDYTLYNENHPNGSAFYGEAIENLPQLEASVHAEYNLRNRLISLNQKEK